MSDEIIRYCNAHKTRVRLLRHPGIGRAVLWACEHTFNTEVSRVFACDVRCAYAIGAQMGAEIGIDMPRQQLNPDGTIPLDLLKQGGFADYTSDDPGPEPESPRTEPGVSAAVPAGVDTAEHAPGKPGTDQQVSPDTSARAGPAPSQTLTEPAAEWYYAVQGKSFGPYTEEQLISCARAGYFKRDDHVYTARLGQWVRADTVSGLFTDVTAGAGAFGQAGAGGTPVYAAPGTWAAAQPAAASLYAGFWIRFLAVFIDGLVLFIPQCLIGMIFAGGIGIWAGFQATGFPAGPPDPAKILSIIGMYILMIAGITVIQWLYFALMESSSWQATLGKRAVGIVVNDGCGRRITFARASGRFFASMLSNMIFYIGYIMGAFMPRKQTLHDIIADTVVVYGRTT